MEMCLNVVTQQMELPCKAMACAQCIIHVHRVAMYHSLTKDSVHVQMHALIHVQNGCTACHMCRPGEMPLDRQTLHGTGQSSGIWPVATATTGSVHWPCCFSSEPMK